MCERCIMDNTDEDIIFDDKGICNHCHQWDRVEKERFVEKQNLPFILDDLKGQKVLLGLSGGADSSLCLHYLLENDIIPITFSLDNKYDTAESANNVKNLVEKTGVKHIKIPVDMQEYNDVQSALFQSGIMNIEALTDHLLMATTYQLANKYGIEYVIGGGNHATEGVMPLSWGHQPRDLKILQSIYKQFKGKKITKLPVCSIWKYIYYRFIKRIKIINLLDYYEYDRENAKILLKEKYSWQDYGEKHDENVFTKWFSAFYLFNKFNIDKRKAHWSSLINSGQMTRDEALGKLSYAPVYPELGIEQKVMSYPRHDYHDYPNQEWLWNFLSKIWLSVK